MEKVGWKLDPHNTTKYLELCRRTVEDDRVFAQFRNMSPMTMIVENSPLKSGKEYYQIIQKEYPWLMNYVGKFQQSDTIGNPRVHRFGPYDFSPSTLRYVKTLGDLHLHFGPLSGLAIAEIGGGYGGLCKIIHDLYAPSDFYMFDLPYPLRLQKKFLSRFEITPVQNEYPEQIDLLIAMYSWSELSEDLQVHYMENVISKAKNCYIMLNYDMDFSYNLIRKHFPADAISDYHMMYDENNRDYAPYDRFIIIKQK